MTSVRAEYPAACAVNKTKLIVCGGWNGTSPLSSCEMLELTSQGLLAGWRSIAGMSTTRTYTSGTLLTDNRTYLVMGGINVRYTSSLSSCEKLDVVTNTWSSTGDLSLGRRFLHCSVLFNSVVVVLGGIGNWNGAYRQTCEQFDSVSNKWSSFPSFLTARGYFGAAVVLNKIYIAGGLNPSPLSSVEVYSGTSWSFLSPSLAQPRPFCAAIAFQSKLVVCTEVFDPITSTWNTTFPPMKISAQAVVSF
jgi:hypothetical protein